jgi:hypothetical protein
MQLNTDFSQIFKTGLKILIYSDENTDKSLVENWNFGWKSGFVAKNAKRKNAKNVFLREILDWIRWNIRAKIYPGFAKMNQIMAQWPVRILRQ